MTTQNTFPAQITSRSSSYTAVRAPLNEVSEDVLSNYINEALQELKSPQYVGDFIVRNLSRLPASQKKASDILRFIDEKTDYKVEHLKIIPPKKSISPIKREFLNNNRLNCASANSYFELTKQELDYERYEDPDSKFFCCCSHLLRLLISR